MPQNRLGIYLTCRTCGASFYVTRGRVKQSAQKSIEIKYCSMQCYDKRGDKNPFWGKTHSDKTIKGFQDTRKWEQAKDPERLRIELQALFDQGYTTGQVATLLHVGHRTIWRYKKQLGVQRAPTNLKHMRWYLRKAIGECQRCGWNTIPEVLQVHHIDPALGNFRANMELLCPNCHMVTHYEHHSGAWANAKD